MSHPDEYVVRFEKLTPEPGGEAQAYQHFHSNGPGWINGVVWAHFSSTGHSWREWLPHKRAYSGWRRLSRWPLYRIAEVTP